MKKLGLRSKLNNGIVEVPMEFIDTFMPQADADFVKVYLYLLRASKDPSIILSTTDLADLFDMTVRRVNNAFTYWQTQGLLSLDYEGSEISDVVLLPYGTQTVLMEKEPAPDLAVSAPEVQEAPTPSPSSVRQTPDMHLTKAPMETRAVITPRLKGSLDDEAFTEFLHVAENYKLKKQISPALRTTFELCYDLFEGQVDILDYLLDYCIDLNKTNASYIEAVAKGWKKDGLNTLSEIRSSADTFSKLNRFTSQVMKALGRAGNTPTEVETTYVERWMQSFSEELILLACRRTTEKTGKNRLRYCNSILEDWKAAGVRSLSDVEALDLRHQAKAEKNTASGKQNSAIHNFPERNNDYDELVKKYSEF